MSLTEIIICVTYPDGTLQHRKPRTGILLTGIIALQESVRTYNEANPRNPIVTTADVSTTIVLPATTHLPEGMQSYVNLDNGKYGGVATRFVSHTWRADAEGLFQAIVAHSIALEADGIPEVCYYLDLAIVDQHAINQVGVIPSADVSRVPTGRAVRDKQRCGRAPAWWYSVCLVNQ